MNVGEMLDQLTVTAEQVNAETGDIIPADFRIKNPTAFAEAFKDLAKGGHTKGYPLAWAKTQDSFVCRPGEVSIIHGLSSSGKTAWLSHNTLYQLQMCKVMVASLEMMPVLQLQRLYAQKYGSPDIVESNIPDFLNSLENLYIYDQGASTTLEDMIAMINWGVLHDVEIFVIDSLMKLSGVSEESMESQKNAMSVLADIAIEHQIHIFIVCHSKKLMNDYDIPLANQISGSQHLRNLASNIICVWRNKEKHSKILNGDITAEDAKTIPDAKVLVQKQRNYFGDDGEPVWNFWFDGKSMLYRERP